MRAREDRDSTLVSGWVRRLDVRQSPLFQGDTQCHTGPSAELSHRDHVRIVRGDSLNDAGEAGTTAMLNVPGKKFHCFLRVCCRRCMGWKYFLLDHITNR